MYNGFYKLFRPYQILSMASPSFDIRLVPEFDGDGDVVDWLDKVDMVCELQTPPADQLVVIPLRLRGGASAVYRQLTTDDRKDLDKVKSALKRAFAANKFAAFEAFIERKLREGESVDVFLAHLQQLSSLFGGLSDEGLACALVSGLPDTVKQILQAGANMESLSLSEIVERARVILREDRNVQGVSAGIRQLPRWKRALAAEKSAAEESISECQPRRNRKNGDPWPERSRAARDVQCYRCSGWGHIAAECPSKYRPGNGKSGNEK